MGPPHFEWGPDPIELCRGGIRSIPEPTPSGCDKGGLEEQPLYLSLGAEPGEAGDGLVALRDRKNCRNGALA